METGEERVGRKQRREDMRKERGQDGERRKRMERQDGQE